MGQGPTWGHRQRGDERGSADTLSRTSRLLEPGGAICHSLNPKVQTVTRAPACGGVLSQQPRGT